MKSIIFREWNGERTHSETGYRVDISLQHKFDRYDPEVKHRNETLQYAVRNLPNSPKSVRTFYKNYQCYYFNTDEYVSSAKYTDEEIRVELPENALTRDEFLKDKLYQSIYHDNMGYVVMTGGARLKQDQDNWEHFMGTPIKKCEWCNKRPFPSMDYDYE